MLRRHMEEGGISTTVTKPTIPGSRVLLGCRMRRQSPPLTTVPTVKMEGFVTPASPRVSTGSTVGRAAQPLTLGGSGACQGSAPVVEGTAHDGVLARLQHDIAVDELLDGSFAVSHQPAQAQLVPAGESGPENHDAQIQQVAVHRVRPPAPGGGEGAPVTRVMADPEEESSCCPRHPTPGTSARSGLGFQLKLEQTPRPGETAAGARPRALPPRGMAWGKRATCLGCFLGPGHCPCAAQLTCCPPGRGQTPERHAPTPSATSPSLAHWPCWGTCPAHAPRASPNGACRYPRSQNTCGEAGLSAGGLLCGCAALAPHPSTLQLTQPGAAGTRSSPASPWGRPALPAPPSPPCPIFCPFPPHKPLPPGHYRT